MKGAGGIARASLGFICLSMMATHAGADQPQPLRQLPGTQSNAATPAPELQGDHTIRQPSNLELKLQINELNRKVEELTALVTRLSQREADRFRVLDIAVNWACKAAANAWNSQGDGEALYEVSRDWCRKQEETWLGGQKETWMGDVPGRDMFEP